MRLIVLLVVLGFGFTPAFADDASTNATTGTAASTTMAAPATPPGNQGYIQGTIPAAENLSTQTTDDNSGDHPIGNIFRMLKRWDAWIRQNLW